MEAYVTALPDEELLAAAAIVVALAPPELQQYVTGRDPHTSPSLRALIHRWHTTGRLQ